MHQKQVSVIIAAVLFGLTCVSLTVFSTPAYAQQEPLTNLVGQVLSPVIDSPGDLLAVQRRRAITLDDAGVAALRDGRDLRLNLFADVAIPALVDRAWQAGVDTWHWQGHMPGDAARSIILVLHKGRLWGTIHAQGVGDFRFRSHENMGQVVEEIQQDQFAPCGCDDRHVVNGPVPGIRPPQRNIMHPDAGGLAGGGGEGEPVCPNTPIIDVMVVYSPEAATQQGGIAEMEAVALGLEAATNVSYENSQVVQRIRVVHIAQIGSELTGFNATLYALTDDGDETYDEVHALRDEHGADLVAMLISHTNGGICGIAWLMGASSLGPDFEQYGFSVTNVGCATGGFTFQHELGHNMGCHHDRNNASSSPAYPYSYGHRFLGKNEQQYRTIMAYAPGTRISHFSNPNISFQGTPTGVPQEVSDQSADNAASLNLTAPVVQAFRDSSPLAGPAGWPTPALLTASDADAGDRFGVSCAIDGELAIIGAYTDDQAATDAGAAYVFRYNATTDAWEEQAKLIAPDAAGNDRFGISVSIVDGVNDDFAIIGSYLDDDAGRDSGAAYVFRSQEGGPWTFEFKIKPTDLAAGDTFGRSVALAASGSTIVACIGSPNDDDAGNNSGAAYIFNRNGSGEWTQTIKLPISGSAANDGAGQSVDVGFAANGDAYAIAGSWRDDDGASNAGAAYVFRKPAAGSWSQVAKLVADDADIEDQAGFAVALAFPDSTTTLAIVGAWKANAPATNSGAAYVFADSGFGFTQEIKLVAADGATDANFGVAVDAHLDAVIIGAYTDHAGALEAGSAYIFRRSAGGATWTQEIKLVSPDPQPAEQMGFSVAINGPRALAGAWGRDADGGTPADIGGVWISGGEGGGGGPGITDCNNNGIEDFCDILAGTSIDLNNNGIPDECEVDPCPADITNDGAVNVSDLLAVIAAWGPCASPPSACPADVAPLGPPQGDGQVNVSDLLLVISAWGVCP